MKCWAVVLASVAGLGLMAEDAFADRSRHHSSSSHRHHSSPTHRHHHVQPQRHHHHHHSHRPRIVVAPTYWPWPYYAAPVYVAPPVIAAPAVVPSMNSGYWYFCPDSRTYYPYVVECGSGWLQVVPGGGPPPG